MGMTHWGKLRVGPLQLSMNASCSSVFKSKNCSRKIQIRFHALSVICHICHQRPGYCSKQAFQLPLLSGLQHLSNMSEALESVLDQVNLSSYQLLPQGKLFFLTNQKSTCVMVIKLYFCLSFPQTVHSSGRVAVCLLNLYVALTLWAQISWDSVHERTTDIFRGRNSV